MAPRCAAGRVKIYEKRSSIKPSGSERKSSLSAKEARGRRAKETGEEDEDEGAEEEEEEQEEKEQALDKLRGEGKYYRVVKRGGMMR